MELSQEIVINAERDRVYAALNDREVLERCIPGCQNLTRESATKLHAKVMLKVGPVKAYFTGTVDLDASKAPASFFLSGQGNGGVAGFARGCADVELAEDDGGTLLKYTAKADVGGKLAQLGSRLIASTATKLAKDFFEELNRVLSAEVQIGSKNDEVGTASKNPV